MPGTEITAMSAVATAVEIIEVSSPTTTATPPSTTTSAATKFKILIRKPLAKVTWVTFCYTFTAASPLTFAASQSQTYGKNHRWRTTEANSVAFMFLLFGVSTVCF